MLSDKHVAYIDHTGIRGPSTISGDSVNTDSLRWATLATSSPTTVLSHRIATHLKTVDAVNQPVEDAIGHGRIADLSDPPFRRGGCLPLVVQRRSPCGKSFRRSRTPFRDRPETVLLHRTVVQETYDRVSPILDTTGGATNTMVPSRPHVPPTIVSVRRTPLPKSSGRRHSSAMTRASMGKKIGARGEYWRERIAEQETAECLCSSFVQNEGSPQPCASTHPREASTAQRLRSSRHLAD